MTGDWMDNKRIEDLEAAVFDLRKRVEFWAKQALELEKRVSELESRPVVYSWPVWVLPSRGEWVMGSSGFEPKDSIGE